MATKKEETKKIETIKAEPQKEEKIVEAFLTVDSAVGFHTVYIANTNVLFENGKALVSQPIHKALKDAGIVK